ncbi:MAG: LON peptidase substrate-binding domain-containing protein, partial [Clostridia bacterium]|nr:LON peptidase substrate-binding domain-containing protein [Clostridia bacterium]
MDNTDRNVYAIPVVALRGLVVFPEMVLHFDIARQKSINAIHAAMEYGQEVFLLTQKSPETENPAFGQLYKTGVIAHIRQVIAVPDSDNLRVIVEGRERAKLENGYDGSFLYADVQKIPQKGYAKKDEEYALALMRKVRDYFNDYADYSPKVAPDVMLRVVDDDSPGGIADYIASVVKLDFAEKQKILETLHPLRRLELVCEILAREIDMLKLESEISRKVEQNVDDNQREYYLREQMRVLSEELDGGDGVDEIDEYRKKINGIKNIEDKYRDKLLKELSRLQKMGGNPSSEATVVRNYLDVVLDLPWDESS